MSHKSWVKKLILESAKTKIKLLENVFVNDIIRAGNMMKAALKNGSKILTAGNGGSAADAQHLAAELAGKFICERPGLPAIALTANTSNVTAIGNDFGYKFVFSKQIEGLGSPGDVFVGISTSGNSKNLIEGINMCRKIGIKTIGLLGKNGGPMRDICDLPIIVPSDNTQNIQEAHIMIIHLICGIIDDIYN